MIELKEEERRQWLRYYLDIDSDTFFNATQAARKLYPQKSYYQAACWGSRTAKILSSEIAAWLTANNMDRESIARRWGRETSRQRWLGHYLDHGADTFFHATKSTIAAGYNCNSEGTCRSIGHQNTLKFEKKIEAWLREHPEAIADIPATSRYGRHSRKAFLP